MNVCMLGLTLEGGGARGAYQIGAWRALRELGMDFHGVTGTSVGALNGALIMQDNFEIAYDLWYNITPCQVMAIDDILTQQRKSLKNVMAMYNELKKIIKDFGVDTSPLEALIKRHLCEETLRTSIKTFGIVTVCLTDLKPLQLFKEDIPEGKVCDYLLASSFLPVFKSKRLDGKKFLDGGIYNNLPVDMLYRKGFREIVVVKLNKRRIPKKVMKEDLKIHCVQPNKSLGGILDFSRENIRQNLKLGYFDTMKCFRNLKGKDYYLYEKIEEERAWNYFMTLKEETIKSLAVLFKIPHCSINKRLIFEEIAPRLFALTGLSKEDGYDALMLVILEKVAKSLNIDAYMFYSINDFLDKIEEKKNKVDINKRGLPTRNTGVRTKQSLLNQVVEILIYDEGGFNI
ncbi:patatin-like phospholipase family protein [Serpentinicella sp. ANB-PHB4]|uniref:patatin-like phospholipase family protein n=1 Tax=Serpentinicella sp. ANB-PHB4 TaxID=3074076 RepID=UPI002854F40C|nr:patatin-like phospholipase family protein [Serpentinicella sp. ANB-PHB4]MDR5659163.1 patatin-like phospholipase family protein [Serpentinicella sp. ANB-PHB4]